MLWHPIMNQQYVLNWHWKHNMLSMFYFNEQTVDFLGHLSSRHMFCSVVELVSLRLAEGDACSAFSGLSLKLFPVFLWTHMHGRTRMHTLRASTCSNVAMLQACTHFDIHILEQICAAKSTFPQFLWILNLESSCCCPLNGNKWFIAFFPKYDQSVCLNSMAAFIGNIGNTQWEAPS